MRVFVLLLVLFNLLVWMWGQAYFTSASPDALRIQKQLRPEALLIVSNDVPPPLSPKPEAEKEAEPPAPPAPLAPEQNALAQPVYAPAPSMPRPPEKKIANVCYQMKELPITEAAQIENIVADKFPSFKVARNAVNERPNYWVHMPASPSRQAAEAKAEELRDLGVTEFFILQETGPNNHAISLGLFSSKEGADSFLTSLRAKGVRSAKIIERNTRPSLVSLELRGPETEASALRKAISAKRAKSKFPSCKASKS